MNERWSARGTNGPRYFFLTVGTTNRIQNTPTEAKPTADHLPQSGAPLKSTVLLMTNTTIKMAEAFTRGFTPRCTSQS